LSGSKLLLELDFYIFL